MNLPLHVVILAAGIGSRMHSEHPKVLHRLAGKPLLAWVLEACTPLNPEKIHIIHGFGGDTLKTTFQHLPLNWVAQAKPLGTAHALSCALPHISATAQILVLSGDVPLIQTQTLTDLIVGTALSEKYSALGILSAILPNPFGYGRIIRDAEKRVTRIMEEKDASPTERQVQEIYTGICLAKQADFASWLDKVTPHNAQNEYYLTQIVALAASQKMPIYTQTVASPMETQGVNTRLELATLERYCQRQAAESLLLKGVAIADPNRIDIRGTLTAGTDVSIDMNTLFEGTVTLGKGCKIGANCVIKDTTLGDHTEILPYTMIDGAEIGAHCIIGPFARLRPGTHLKSKCKIGNFVETKKITMEEGSKANHLTYLGDADIGKAVNIGAGTITCNYDGVNKHKTIIESGVFIGSGTELVAPIRIGKNATLGAGTTLREDAPAEALTLSLKKQQTVTTWKRPKQGLQIKK